MQHLHHLPTVLDKHVSLPNHTKQPRFDAYQFETVDSSTKLDPNIRALITTNTIESIRDTVCIYYVNETSRWVPVASSLGCQTIVQAMAIISSSIKQKVKKDRRRSLLN